MPTKKMTSTEFRAVTSLASIMGLRMLGLFMVLPVFSLYAAGLQGATATLIGIAMGIYGLSQALFQIPFGSLSDKVGRRPMIAIGLLIFMCGSLIAGFAHSIYWMIIGRALQGTGAVGSTTLAMVADLTRENQRTKAMAIAGITIGFSFSAAMFIGPVMTQWLPIHYLFFIAAFMGLLATIILYWCVPTPSITHWEPSAEPTRQSFWALLHSPELAKLNSGIFFLHAIFTASFVVIPISLLRYATLEANRQWVVYLPTLLVAFLIALFFIGQAERSKHLKPYFLGGILTIALSEVLLWLAPGHFTLAVIGLCLFFAGFSLLEAFLPSLISRTAPPAQKGSALGLFSCSQFLGIFIGGVLGGWLYGQFQFLGVYLFCVILSLFWFALILPRSVLPNFR